MPVRLTRRVSFSSGHRYWIPSLSEEENRARFGQWASPYNHGHNYVLDVTTEGSVDPRNGMVVNIKDIDDVLKRDVVGQLDSKSINDEIPHFQDKASSIENLILFIEAQLENLPGEATLVALRLEEMPTLFAELDIKTKTMTITRVYEFAASHRLHSPFMSDAQNQEMFGKCNNPSGHGHNYVLEVTVSGQPDERTGMIADILEIDRVVEERVVDRYDHKFLNCDVPEFEEKVVSSEVIVQEIWKALDGHLPAKLHRVRLYETARSIFELEAQSSQSA
jgi:6-pyruvoyltetrahydropterin/6-carboxytetrahydropterin synthase